MVEAYTSPGDLVLDPMSGIGMIGVEALRLGRRYVGIELEPAYVRFQLDNLNRVKRLGDCPEFALLRGDARSLDPALLHGVTDLLHGLGPFDAVLTFPPFGGTGGHPRKGATPSFLRLVREGRLGATSLPHAHHLSRENLGNLKADRAYFEGMRRVYSGCFKILKPGGLLAVCCRPARQRERLRPLYHQTVGLCEEAGFTFLEEVVAVLGRVRLSAEWRAEVATHASFGQCRSVALLRGRGLPVSLNQVEYVLLFRKPDGGSDRRSNRTTNGAARKPPRGVRSLAVG